MPSKDNTIERRREALLIATRLQRRNVAARWNQLKDHRVIGFAESAKTMADAMRGSSSLSGAATGSLTAMASSALWALRERSAWGLVAIATKWWLRRRDRQRLRREAISLALASPRATDRRSLFSSRARQAL